MCKRGCTVGRANTVTTAQTILLCNLYKEIVTLSLLDVIRKAENFYAITYCTFTNVESIDQLNVINELTSKVTTRKKHKS
jgi:hypothetical protein